MAKLVTFVGHGDKFYHEGLPLIEKGIVTPVSDSDFECLKGMKGIMKIKGIKKEIAEPFFMRNFKEKLIKEEVKK